MMRFSRGCNQVKLKRGATTVANTGVSFVGAVTTAVAVAATVPIVLCRCCCLVTAATSANGAGATADNLIVVIMIADNQKWIDHCKRAFKSEPEDHTREGM